MRRYALTPRDPQCFNILPYVHVRTYTHLCPFFDHFNLRGAALFDQLQSIMYNTRNMQVVFTIRSAGYVCFYHLGRFATRHFYFTILVHCNTRHTCVHQLIGVCHCNHSFKKIFLDPALA